MDIEALYDHLGITADQVMSMCEYADHIAVVVNNGIKGCPKYIVQKDDIKPLAKPEPAKAKTEAVRPMPRKAPAKKRGST